MKTQKKLTLLALFASVTAAYSQTYSVDWSSFDGSGGVSSGGIYSISGTIGQPDATPQPMSGGAFSIEGGFWSVFAVQTPGAPRLTVTLNPGVLLTTVSWPSASAGFTLQQSADLATAAWTAVTQSVSDNGTSKFITIDSRVGRKFYRLIKP